MYPDPLASTAGGRIERTVLPPPIERLSPFMTHYDPLQKVGKEDSSKSSKPSRIPAPDPLSTPQCGVVTVPKADG